MKKFTLAATALVLAAPAFAQEIAPTMAPSPSLAEATAPRPHRAAGITTDLAVEAAKDALAHRGIPASELDAIIVCTVTPDMLFPGTACLVQHKIGATKAWGFDLIAA